MLRLGESFGADVAEVRGVADALRSCRADADRRVTALLSTWSGPAADSFAAAWEEWREGAATVLVALEGMADLMHAVQADVLAQDARAHGRMTALAGRLAERLG